MEEERFWSSDGIWVLKLILLSVLISVGIKTLGSNLALPPTNAVILSLVFLPPVILTAALGWRYFAVKN